jgi:hypothetical protein
VPEGSKLLMKLIGDAPKQFDMQEFVNMDSLRPPDLPNSFPPTAPDSRVEVEFGIYRSPEEWHHEATCVPHPFDNRSFLREWQLAALKAILESQRHDTASHCIQFINKYTKRRDELLEAESLLHGRMEPRIREIMRRKNILLFLEVLAYAGISDSLIGKQLQEGFPISGELGSSHLFDQEKRDASITKEYLMRDAGWWAKAAYANARPGAFYRSGTCSHDEASFKCE